ncbi:MAG: hypothetical protein SCALA702_21630 [Melioribacteraceae bacterium]|nr:MAG: hypothetical protein SCALA702_21630 [Melioribacteraceae bacterium]
MKLNLKVFIIIALFLSTYVIGQVSYSGPASGSVSSGVVMNTNLFTEDAGAESPRLKLFKHIKAELLPPPADAIEATGPEGSNVIIDPASYIEDVSDDDVTLFRDFYGINQTSSIPPDPYVAVGPNHIIQVVNSTFRISTKDGQTLRTITGNSWFSSTHSGANVFDPKVIYDHFDERWVMVWLHLNEFSNEAYFLVSVSDDSDPTGVWYNWKLNSTTNGNSYAGNWADYQGVGYDDKAIYITSNQFSFSFSYNYTKIRIVPKADLYANTAGSVTWTDIWNIKYPQSGASSFGIRPARMQSASDDYYLAVVGPYTTNSTFGIYTLSNPLSNPSLDGKQVSVTSYSSPPNTQQLGGGSPAIDDGGMNLRNEPVFQDGILHMTHAVKSGTKSGVRYLSVNPNTYTAVNDWTLADNSHYHVYPALAVNGFGDVVFSYSRSSSTEYMGAYYTVLKAGESSPVGTQELKPGNGNYVKTYGGSRNRWGDYNGAWMDPANPDDFWVMTEYVYSTNTWGIWVGGINVANVGNTVVWDAGITVTSGTDSEDLTFGQSKWATDGIDENLEENELPPVPPAGVFDARFNLPTNQASLRDIRHEDEVVIEWELQFQPGSSSDPILLTWDNTQLTAGKYILKDNLGGILFSYNMANFNAFQIPNSSITSVIIEYSEQVNSTISVNPSWNMVSIPVTLDDMSVTSVFPNATSNAFTFEGGYNQVSEFENGKAYWLKFGAGDDIPVQGGKVPGNIALNAGWNMIGPFDETISVDDITTEPAGIIGSAFFGFEDFYQNIDALAPGKGYWVKATQAGSIIVDQAVKKAAPAFASINSEWAKIVVTDAAGHTSTLYASGSNNLNMYDLPPAPPAGAFDVRFSSGKFVENMSAAQKIDIKDAVYPVTIAVQGADIKLKDVVTGNLFNAVLADNNEIVISDNNITSLEVSSNILPETITLGQNYPNPFNPVTKINFTLPVESKVKLSVFNILGELVAVPVDAVMNAGEHSVDFAAGNLASGTYIYRLTAGDASLTRKMVILK